jgi:hypothetical protein
MSTEREKHKQKHMGKERAYSVRPSNTSGDPCQASLLGVDLQLGMGAGGDPTAPQTTSVVGKRLPPLQSHTFEWVRDWIRVIGALHHNIDKFEQHSLDGI